MQYKKIAQFKYDDKEESLIPLLSYILYADTNDDKFALFKFKNNSTVKVNNYTVKVIQYDANGIDIQTDDITFDDLEVSVYQEFVPFTRIMINAETDHFIVEPIKINGVGIQEFIPTADVVPDDNTNYIRKIRKSNKIRRRRIPIALIGLAVLAIVGSGFYFGMSSITKYMQNLTEFEDNGFTITNTGVITKYSSSTRNLVIPESIAGQKVKRIGKSVFSGKDIQTLSINAEGVVIEESAFSSCTSLVSLSIVGECSVSASAFANCSSLANVSAPKLTYIGAAAFSNTKITKFASDSAFTVATSAFNNTPLEEYSCPNSTLEGGALGEGSSIKQISYKSSASGNILGLFQKMNGLVLESVTSAEMYYTRDYFKEIPSLKKVNFNSNGFVIDKECLTFLSSLDNYKIEDGIEYVGDCAINIEVNTSDYVLKNGFSRYSENVLKALSGVSNLTIDIQSGVIPDGLIPSYLNSLTITESTKLEKGVFKGLYSVYNLDIPALDKKLTEYFPPDIIIENVRIYGRGSIIPNYLDGMNNVKNISISDEMIMIGSNFVDRNQNLQSVEIPNGVSMSAPIIGANCSSLRKVTMPLGGYYSSYNSSYDKTKELHIVGNSNIDALSNRMYGIVKISINNTKMNLGPVANLEILEINSLSGSSISDMNVDILRLKTIIFNGVTSSNFINMKLSNINVMLLNGASLSSSDVNNLTNINLYVDDLSSKMTFSGYKDGTVNCLVYNNNRPSIYTYKEIHSRVDNNNHYYTVISEGQTYYYNSVFIDSPLMIVDQSGMKQYSFNTNSAFLPAGEIITISTLIQYTYNIYRTIHPKITYYIDGSIWSNQILYSENEELMTVSDDRFSGWYYDSNYTLPVRNTDVIGEDINLYGRYLSNVLTAGMNKIESNATWYINGNLYDNFIVKVYSSKPNSYRIISEDNLYYFLNIDEYGICNEAKIDNSKGLYSILLYSGDIVVLEAYSSYKTVSISAIISEVFLMTTHNNSYYYTYLDLSSITNDRFIGLFLDNGIQITDSTGYIYSPYNLDSILNSNYSFKLYARYNEI